MEVSTVNYESVDASKQFTNSFLKTGFGILSNHSIDLDLIQEVYTIWEEFFESGEKIKYLFNKKSPDGYFPYLYESGKNCKPSDLKEFYYYYPWGKCPKYLHEATNALYNQLYKLATTLLDWLTINTPQKVLDKLPMTFGEMIKDSQRAVLRIIHYPPLQNEAIKNAIDQGAFRAASHEDINLLTLLPAATEAGLQILDRSGEWHEIKSDPSNIIVNAGDMLELLSHRYYKSTTHRVQNPIADDANRSRYAMSFFFNPKDNVLLPTGQTAGEYLIDHLIKKVAFESTKL